MAAEVLVKVCKSVSREDIEVFVLEKIYELIYDRNLTIRLNALNLLVGMFDRLSP